MKPGTRVACVVIVLLAGWLLAVPFRKPAEPDGSTARARPHELNIRHRVAGRLSRPIAEPIKLTPDNSPPATSAPRSEFDHTSHFAPIGDFFPTSMSPARITLSQPASQLTSPPRTQVSPITDDARPKGKDPGSELARTEHSRNEKLRTNATFRQRWHRVVNGDSLPRLAESYLGNRDDYLLIFEANRDVLASPSVLPIGVELKIPPTPAATGSATPPRNPTWQN